MKIFNLTDIETPVLAQHGFVNQHFAVGDKMIAPGASAEVDDETFARTQPELQKLIVLGALSAGALPDGYKGGVKSPADVPAPAEAPAPAADDLAATATEGVSAVEETKPSKKGK